MKVGFTIGKFAPLHKGHEALIEKGIRENDEFYILINDTDITTVPLEERANWIKTLYPTAKVILGKHPPKQYGMDEKSIKIQTDYLKEMFKGIPVTSFYSSEQYGKYVARDLNVENITVEKFIPVNATLIRNDPKKYKNYMEDVVYNYFLC